MRITIIGAEGFVGTGLCLYLKNSGGFEIVPVVRGNYHSLKRTPSDIVIDVAGNSKKYLSDSDPLQDLELTVIHRLRTIHDFPAKRHIHVSSIDVYSDITSLETTHEDATIDLKKISNYGLHKLLAEQIVQHYVSDWLILRLGGMVGPRLRKNPVFDLLNTKPLWIHPNSEYQFMHTEEVSRIIAALINAGISKEIYNVCGDGLISPREIAKIADRTCNTASLPENTKPRIIHANIEKLKKFTSVEKTRTALKRFCQEYKSLGEKA